MNVLVIAFHQIYPLETGASISQFGIIEYLSHLCNVSLLVPEDSNLTHQEFSELNQLLPKVKIYILDSQFKSTSNDIGSNIYNYLLAVKEKVKPFLKFLLKRTKSVQKISAEEEFAAMFSTWKPYYIHSQKYVEKINEVILQDNIDIVQLEYVENLNLVKAIPSHIKKVFVEHECLFYRIQSHINAKQIKSVFAEYVLNFYKSIEMVLLEKVDGIVTFNDSESVILENALGDKKNKIEFLVSPFPILERDFKKIDKDKFEQPNKLIFVGAEHHFPNKDAVEWFIEEIAESVFTKFGLRLCVIGKWTLDTVKKYKNHPSKVDFVGFLEDIYEFSKNSISIAPVRMGGGLKTKIMLAMAQGIPVISTKFALEGINAKHLESVMIADDKDSFCWSIKYLLTDLERTFMICQNAQNIIKQGYSQSVVSELRYSFYQQLLKENHRAQSKWL
ncbi:MAG: glycosyltransferase [Stigonema ocellatum SAG 48.90 = DSM 106950]|nr:glycosyltransferase [Stigonema ocellatum SAG 48.90 = DSM 106950]